MREEANERGDTRGAETKNRHKREEEVCRERGTDVKDGTQEPVKK